MNTPIDKKRVAHSAWTRLRIWWWKWRYVERMLSVLEERSSGAIKAAKQCAGQDWQNALEWNDGDVPSALKESPTGAADEELTYWNEG